MSSVRKYTLKRPQRTSPYRVRYEDDLNQEQLDVVMAGGGPILVVAGAGSGKTRALTYRVSRLIEDGTPPGSILLLTFTNKAAREMIARVETLVTADVRQISAGTFHAVGNRILRRHAEVLGYRGNFSILDQEDAKEMMDAAVSARGIETLDKRFPKGDVLLDIFSFVVNTSTSLEMYVEENYPQFLSDLDRMRSVFATYREKKKAANVMDFDDLLLHWLTLLEEYPEVSEALKSRYRHILVDEYQDTNTLQARIIDGMASLRRNVMVVGDDAQSIYSFRGASFENIITFPVRYPDASIYRLETNYRSTPQILELANHTISRNRYQFPKELSAVRGDGPLPAVVGVDDVHEQATFVAQRILELRDEGEELSDIAILYRSHYQSLEIQMELSRRNIPYEIRSGVRFFEQAHIKDVLAHVRIPVNPRDELSWKRALKLLPKVGERSASLVWDTLSSAPDPLSSFLRKVPAVPARAAGPALQKFRGLIERISSQSMMKNPSEMIRMVVEDGGYADYARTKFPNASARLDDLEQLAQYASRYSSVEDFLEELTLTNTLAGEDVAVVGPEDERVILSSVHQAKGLEWRSVFIVWLAEGRFPSARALRVPGGIIRAPRRQLPTHLLADGETPAADETEVEIIVPGEEEERRLFYVAVTRAQQELYLVFPVMARDRMQMDILMEPSRFVRELPSGSYEKWVIANER
jgi:DNA helicase II / ATP-dependent DNA helicase PcrA